MACMHFSLLTAMITQSPRPSPLLQVVTGGVEWLGNNDIEPDALNNAELVGAEGAVTCSKQVAHLHTCPEETGGRWGPCEVLCSCCEGVQTASRGRPGSSTCP